MGVILLEGLPRWLSGQCRHGLDHLLLTRRSQLWEARVCSNGAHTPDPQDQEEHKGRY